MWSCLTRLFLVQPRCKGKAIKTHYTCMIPKECMMPSENNSSPPTENELIQCRQNRLFFGKKRASQLPLLVVILSNALQCLVVWSLPGVTVSVLWLCIRKMQKAFTCPLSPTQSRAVHSSISKASFISALRHLWSANRLSTTAQNTKSFFIH